MSSLIMPRRRTSFRLGDPCKSDELKKRFMPFVGKEYITVVCIRHDLPYRPISGWLWKDGVLAEDLQRAVEAVLNNNPRKP